MFIREWPGFWYRRDERRPPGEYRGAARLALPCLVRDAQTVQVGVGGAAYWAALSKSQWLVLEDAVPGKFQLSTTSGLNIMVSRNQKKGMSAKL